jgi:hypothetical protein
MKARIPRAEAVSLVDRVVVAPSVANPLISLARKRADHLNVVHALLAEEELLSEKVGLQVLRAMRPLHARILP